MDQTREERQDRARKTVRMLALAVGLWFLGSGLWGLITETPADRAVSGCEAAARQKAEPDAGVQQTASREEQGGWFVAGEVRRSIDNVVTVTHLWECTADAEGKNPTITAWNPAA